ncbi:MAG: sugar-transfer associated ATP-grasp domain-containing protein [Actinophytocola sp.]|uniref:sugar-transfer associated ATP-grasp domain-containing protein n=1 Tax=Actinophytocola sp. TaxID=1872138 RepID=UPI003C7959F5
MKFNKRINELGEWFRRIAVPRITAPYWVAHQVKNSVTTYIPSLAAESKRKPVRTMLTEMTAATIRWRCLPFHYLRYELYTTDVGIDEVLSYVPDTIFYSRILPNVNAGTVLLDDKVTCKRILSAANVEQPSLIAVGEGSACWSASGELIPTGRLDAVASTEKVVIKPARNTAGGDGVQVLRLVGGRLSNLDGRTFDLDKYIREWNAWLIESYVQQDDELAVLNPHSLNTLRVITVFGQPVFCILKSGTGDGPIDNACGGGLYVRVDPETGQLDPVARTTSMRRYTTHPVTGISFRDLRITCIRAVLELSVRAAGLFPQTPVIGWDIAVADGAPMIIEGNSSPSLLNIQRTHGGLDDTLGTGLMRRPVNSWGQHAYTQPGQ